MMRNMAGMMKKVQEMQSRMEALQQEMADTEFSAAVGGGAVQVTVPGKGEMRGVKIDPAAVDPADISMLEDMIRLAANNARAEADAAMAAKMKDITGGMPLPPGMSLPFCARRDGRTARHADSPPRAASGAWTSLGAARRPASSAES